MASDEYYEDEEDTTPKRRSLRSAPAPRAAAPRARVEDDDETPAPRTSVGSRLKVRRGWSAGEKVIDSTSSFAQNFKPNEDDVVIKFLEDEPYAAYSRHWVERVVPGSGKQMRTYICLESLGDKCPLCDVLGDRPQAITAFNIAVVGDNGDVTLKSWDVGVKIFRTLDRFRKDQKFGPLTKSYYVVKKTGKGLNSETTMLPIKASNLLEDYGLNPVGPDELADLSLYDESIVEIPKRSELQAIADEQSDSGEYA
jgi:hypothetical protein